MPLSSADVIELKKALEKGHPAESAESQERCRDVLQRLDECDMTIQILTDSLIGAAVSKFKSHEELGPTAKALVKKWKQIAKSATGKPQSSPKAAKKKAAAKKTSPPAAKKPENSAERRSSVASASSDVGAVDAQTEWEDLPPQRQNICKKIHSFLVLAKPNLIKSGLNEAAIDHLTVSRTSEVEAAIHIAFAQDRSGYADKARSLSFNIKKNSNLREDIIMGSVSAEALVKMTPEQLASDEKRKEREEQARKLKDSKRLDWDVANEDKINNMCGIKGDLLAASLFTCGRCKSVKTTSTQKQTRSADEPMTVFVLCLNCGKRWKC